MKKVHRTVRVDQKIDAHIKNMANKSHDNNYSVALNKLCAMGMRKQKKEDGANVQQVQG